MVIVTREIIVLATAVVGLATACVVGFIMIWREIRGMHKLINSRMDELLELTRKAAHAAGAKQERDRSSGN